MKCTNTSLLGLPVRTEKYGTVRYGRHKPDDPHPLSTIGSFFPSGFGQTVAKTTVIGASKATTGTGSSYLRS